MANMQLWSVISNAQITLDDGLFYGGGSGGFFDLTYTQSDAPELLSFNGGEQMTMSITFAQATAPAGLYIESITASGVEAVLQNSNGDQVGSAQQFGDVLLLLFNGLADTEFTVLITAPSGSFQMSKPVLLGFDVAHAVGMIYDWGYKTKPQADAKMIHTKDASYTHALNNRRAVSIVIDEIDNKGLALWANFCDDFAARPVLLVLLDKQQERSYYFGTLTVPDANHAGHNLGQQQLTITAMHDRVIAQEDAPWR